MIRRFRITKQKLLVELKNTPRDTSLVPCSVNYGLNKDESLSDHGKVLANNNSEENLPVLLVSETSLKLNKKPVFVLNQNNQPLTPCSSIKARHLLKQGRARVVKRKPFTIQLKWNCETKQEITLGLDPGYKDIGFSVVTKNRELISGNLKLRTDISKKIETRAMYRRTRRNRLWHREPRWNNRTSTKKEGWLAPSIRTKLDTHIRLVNKLKELLPIERIIVEVSNFDTQKLTNKGIEYQQGELQGYNVKEYLLQKYSYKCVYCKKSNVPLEIEHITPKSRNGSNRISNLTISCRKCNMKKGNKTAKEFGYPRLQTKVDDLKQSAFMNNIRWKLVDILKKQNDNVTHTYGYITKYNRIKLKLSKTHSNDAFVIAKGNGQIRCKEYNITQTRRNNRKLQTNRKHSVLIRRKRYKLQPNDLVKYKGMICKSKGVFNYGEWITLVNNIGEMINTNSKNVELIKYGKGLLFS